MLLSERYRLSVRSISTVPNLGSAVERVRAVPVASLIFLQ
ncbi:hypothetical protein ALQ07_100821 [Pseudomonas syringae pv. actinidiae]|uniref:Uncharacterized protein n=3 Tax=Pseudomonas syringae group TaxID=136849 RepID=A0A2V0Q5G0_PSESF|nr:hypothetical protein ALQ95_00440 [Pseudomonas syringae pv. ribicola]RMQ30150.1 hypothetical protein ALQ07_100821 [Pseudomonas syringae pv. actinidiae]RMT58328.1 hypothetical protein ALP44_100804 [Pseudomonas syringae pv. theae]GBH07933.1 hypothetical protein KPSA1_01297 [Pseudomonas syringae pv. actinidiae]GBH20059.1 hypothetical protein KPSA3_06081 [Pseudomonas syringae pv. actinidiae]